MNKNNRNNEQIYGRNDMIMLDQNNKIYGSLGLADRYVMKTEEETIGYGTYTTTIKGLMVSIGDKVIPWEPYTGGQPSPSPDYPQEIKSVVNPIVKVTNEDETESQTVTLPYTLNAIPVSSGGNVTIGEQQYISDYADIENNYNTWMKATYKSTESV